MTSNTMSVCDGVAAGRLMLYGVSTMETTWDFDGNGVLSPIKNIFFNLEFPL
jgi:hypothetical protein